jgi:hypothetical protein
MDFNATLELIIKDLNDACLIIDDFRNYHGVPALHVELAKAKCRSSAEVIALLKNAETAVTGKKPDTAVLTPIQEDKKPAEKDTAAADRTVKPVAQHGEQSIVEPTAARPPEEKAQQKPVSIIADSFTGMPASINEQLGAGKNRDGVTELIKSRHIDSLDSVIGLNDRFLLIRELFGGDSSRYNQAIARLEQAVSEDDAKAIISGYSGADNEATALLLDLIKRKLGTNG